MIANKVTPFCRGGIATVRGRRGIEFEIRF